ncbi:MAG: MvaI/BcnI family restriction endonuclease [Methylophilaceae bacterium]|nr:MvaI/BcnI family restriction endonuclease [Methylophilaceae bacterium]
MNLAEFKIKFNAIKEKGYLPSTRRGPTGIGHTLEKLLGITENNSAHADIEGAELKAHRHQSNNLITLFTFNNKVWAIPPLDAIKKYGSYDEKGRQGLYYTMSLKPNSAGLFLDVQQTDISVRHISGTVIATWSLQKLAERFMQKIPALLLVSAFTEERAGIEHFHYYRAQLMKGASAEILSNQFKSETILVDLRLHDKGTMARNHGTGFRTHADKLPLLFQSIEVL